VISSYILRQPESQVLFKNIFSFSANQHKHTPLYFGIILYEENFIHADAPSSALLYFFCLKRSRISIFPVAAAACAIPAR